MKRKSIKIALLCMVTTIPLNLSAAERFVAFRPENGCTLLQTQEKTLHIFIDEQEFQGIKTATSNLVRDIGNVTGNQPETVGRMTPDTRLVVGSVEKNGIIKRLIKEKKLNGKELQGKREKYIITTVNDNGNTYTVIAGSDKRGAIYGIYELAEQMGVSPWYWWADVPVEKHKELYILPGTYTDGEPAVRYRGIFINDEWPAFGGWAKEKFGGINSKMYVHMYELILRLKGNFLWPAMWASAFYEDDPESSRLADEMGIIIGTSHHEPMARNHQEYARRRKEIGPWNYDTNKDGLNRFFRKGIERIKGTEDIVTIGMRGDGDEPMGKDANLQLLERIVADQRKIIRDVTGKKPEKTPQVWALYKEVQEYYEKGMRVPDDVILLLCDDNWGNVRLLPELQEEKHKGGYGMYYHVDYVGGPRNTKWINVSQIQRIWEQMQLTYSYGVDQLWILNVGDLKPMEFPIDFFLRMAWNPGRFNAGNLMEYTEAFCRQQFGEREAKEAARILNLQGKYVHRRTAELLWHNTYSLHTGEWERVLGDYKRLESDALNQYQLLDEKYRDTYQELILFPVQAMANLYDMYYAYAMNSRLAAENRPEANDWADRAYRLYLRDSLLCDHYNKHIAGGKWNHMMDEIHIGYTSWNGPKKRYFPAPQRVNADSVNAARKQNGNPDKGYVFTSASPKGIIAMEAEHYWKATDGNKTQWTVIPDFGKTLSGLALMPYTEPTDQGEVTYKFQSSKDGEVMVHLYLAPTFPFNNNRGQRIEVRTDGENAQTININNRKEEYQWQANRINIRTVKMPLKHKDDGMHTLTLSPLDPGVVIERIVITRITDGKEVKADYNYLGEPESPYHIENLK